MKMTKLNIISRNSENTLVAEFVPDQKRERDDAGIFASLAVAISRF